MLPAQLRLLAAGGKPVIWVHAVSVGEILAVAALIQEMRQRFADYAIAISTTTSTGYKLAGERFGAENVFFFPLDLSFTVGRYMRLLRPRLVVIAETEFWPNFLRAARRSGAAVAVVNARISDRSYPRYKMFTFLLRQVLRNVDGFLAQTEEDAQRLVSIGAEPARVQVAGNLKFDAEAPAAKPEVGQLLARVQEISAGPIAVLGSTVEGEEQMLVPTLRAILGQHPRALVILAPRHKERFEAVAELLEQLRHCFHPALVSGVAAERDLRKCSPARYHRRTGVGLLVGIRCLCRRQPGPRAADTTSWSRPASAFRSSLDRTRKTSATSCKSSPRAEESWWCAISTNFNPRCCACWLIRWSVSSSANGHWRS